MEATSLTWRRASRSGTSQGDGNCVEVATTAGRVMVRDSKDPGSTLAFRRADWRAFLADLERP